MHPEPAQNPLLSTRPALTRKDLRAVAVVAQVDERTCTKRLAGMKVRPTCAARIDAALASLGLAATAAPRG